ncbi:hypothetical protein [Candidatus Albibeggiatoa sp. nov. BB20]|uniref:hypothetical protein n=1 Tax=Candidatus Albibeggiatoa sp. nov. BB20 TaxID=3162723 RepID=UPI003365909E
MNKSQLFRQHGAGLLLMLITLLLAVMTVVLSALNDRYDYRLSQNQQTQNALLQAKQALIGFAASYDQTHSDTAGAFVGYLPCPDITGDGSANPPCANAAETVLGRFPWRTLGLPPLRDGSGECLWYAVSGSFKDNPDMIISHDTDGDIIIKDVHGGILYGNSALNRAIAVVFAPNKPLSSQTRSGGDNLSNKTACGYEDSINAELNQASNYLDSLESVNNATGDAILNSYDTSNRIFRDENEADDDYPTFIRATTTYDSDGKEIFNDTLAIITPEDFAPVYKLMDYRVVSKATTCIEQYSNDNRFNVVKNYSIPIGDWDTPQAETYRANSTIANEIALYVNEKISNCKYNNCNNINCISDCDTAQTTCENNCKSASKTENYKKIAVAVSTNYPWTSGLDDSSFKEQNGERFGRIPSILLADSTTNPLAVSKSQNNDMSDSWPTDCFNENSWTWWKVWKDQIFYALDDEYVTQPETQIWINTERAASFTGSGVNKVWTREDRDVFIARKTARKEATISKLTDKTAYNGWADSDVISIATPTSLLLSGTEHPFMVISAGRRLALNQGSTETNYLAFTQIRNTADFCAVYSISCTTCTTTPYVSGCYKSRIDNYLEGEAHSTLDLRNVVNGAMVGGNIPTDYNTEAVAHIPSGDEAFIQDDLDIDFFTDFSCYSSKECNLTYKK